MSANDPKDSFIRNSSHKEEGSDTDSMGYEPEQKKCRLEEGSQGEALLDSDRDSLIAVLIRPSTVVVSNSSQNISGSNNSSRNEAPSEEVEGDRRSVSLITIGELVQQTLEASLGPHPIRQMSSISQGGLFSQLNDYPETDIPRVDRSPPEPPPIAPYSQGGPTSGLQSSQRYTHGSGSGQRGRRLHENTLQQNDDNANQSGSSLDINISENPIENGIITTETDDEVLQRSHSPPQDLTEEETENNFADYENLKSDGDAYSEPTQQPPNYSIEPIASDSELSEKDKGLCKQCHAQKTSPFFNFCLRCFKIHRTWLPPRPASRRLKSGKTHLRNSNTNSFNNSTNLTGLNSAGSTQIQRFLPISRTIDMNEGFLIDGNNPVVNRLTPDTQPGNVTLMELFTQPETRATCCNESTTMTAPDTDSQSQSQSVSSFSQFRGSRCSQVFQNSVNTQSSPSPLQPLQISAPMSKNTNNDIIPSLNSSCAICFVREKDAVFVHNKIAHHYCCYTCADKILKKNGKCPICRERILRVVKIISV